MDTLVNTPLFLKLNLFFWKSIAVVAGREVWVRVTWGGVEMALEVLPYTALFTVLKDLSGYLLFGEASC